MKNSTLFWGVFLIILGLLLLLNQMDILSVSLGSVFKFWPIILIIWGVSLLRLPDIYKKVLLGLTALLLAIFVSGLFSFDRHDFKHFHIRWDSNEKEFEILDESGPHSATTPGTNLNVIYK